MSEEQVIVILDGGRLGPFEDEQKAQEYLDLLQVKGEIVPLTAPPQMSDLFLAALTHIRENGELESFLQRCIDTGHTNEEARAAFDQAERLNKVAMFNEDALNNRELARLILKRYPDQRITAIKELRWKRPTLGLKGARDLIYDVGGYW